MKRLLYFLLPVILILAVFFLVGLVKPVVTYENSVTIERPVDKTFMVFTDATKMGQWLSGFKKMELVKGMPTLPGSLVKMTFEMNGREVVVTEEVLDFKWNSLFSFRLHHENMTIDCEYTFRAVDSNSEINSKLTVEGKNIIWRSLNVFLKGKMSRQTQGDLEKLKVVIEAN
jgi:hypothetical protein